MFPGMFGPSPREAQIERFEKEFRDAHKGATNQKAGACNFDILLQTPQSGVVPLRIFLPPKFPDEAPVLQLLKPFRHPWVDQYNRVTGHAYLHNWESSFDLTLLVKEVISTLSQPPTRSPSVTQPAPANGPPPYDAVSQQRAAAQPHFSSRPTDSAPMRQEPRENAFSERAPHGVEDLSRSPAHPERTGEDEELVTAPGVPDSFPELDALDVDTINTLLQDSVAFNDFVVEMENVKTLRDLREGVIRENAKIAGSTCAHQEELESLHAEVSSLQADLRELKREYDLKADSQLSKDLERFSIANVKDALRDRAADLDDASEELSSQLESDEMPVNQFVKKYLQERKLYHRRTALLELSYKWGS